MIQSPLNYTGGKYKLLPQILPLFPKDIDVFVDLFCGGCNVGINVDCNWVIYNDLNENLLYLYNTFKNLDKKSVLEWIYEIIEKYNLSLVSKHGYDYYGCESSKGLGNYNREGYLRLRADFNQKHANENFDYYYYVMLYVIIVYAFNNQIRFNSNGEFNLPVGKRDFNKKMEQKLIDFIDKIQSQNCTFTCCDFREFDKSALTSQDFVYIDPPYLITCATYNEQGGWSEADEKDLLTFLDELNGRNIRFAFATLELPSILNKYNGKSKEDIKEILGEAFHKFNSIRKRNLKLYDGVEDTLKQLFENGITIIGYTESAQENGFYRLKKLGITQYFKNIYTSESKYISDIPLDKKIITVKTKKPDKDILITICKQEKCSISETVYIGDSLTKDVYMAKMANITSIWANYPKDNNNYYNLLVDITSWTEEDFKKEKELKEQFVLSNIKPDYMISKFSQVLPIVLQEI